MNNNFLNVFNNFSKLQKKNLILEKQLKKELIFNIYIYLILF